MRVLFGRTLHNVNRVLNDADDVPVYVCVLDVIL